MRLLWTASLARPLVMGRDIARNNRRLDTREFPELHA